MSNSIFDLKEQLKRAQSQLDMYKIFLFDHVCMRRPDAEAESDDHTFRGELYRALGADGGYVLLINCTGSSLNPAIYRLDDIKGDGWPLAAKIVAERLRITRGKLEREEFILRELAHLNQS